MDICFIRHGETDWNTQGRMQGREDIPLNETGLAQARECSEALKNMPFTLMLTSPLQRARQTAEEILKYHSCPLIVRPELIERDYGLLSGLTAPERQEWLRSGKPHGMETPEALMKRAGEALDAIAADYPGETIAAVSHGAFLKALLSAVCDDPTGESVPLLKNACICVLRREENGWSILQNNLSAKEFAERAKCS